MLFSTKTPVSGQPETGVFVSSEFLCIFSIITTYSHDRLKIIAIFATSQYPKEGFYGFNQRYFNSATPTATLVGRLGVGALHHRLLRPARVPTLRSPAD